MVSHLQVDMAKQAGRVRFGLGHINWAVGQMGHFKWVKTGSGQSSCGSGRVDIPKYKTKLQMTYWIIHLTKNKNI